MTALLTHSLRGLALLALLAGPVLAEVPFSGSTSAEPAAPAPVEPQSFPTGAADPMAPQPLPPPITSIAPVIIANGAAISDFEIDQRVAFLTALQQQGDLRTLALQALIGERLQSVEARRLGLSVTPEQIRGGMEEFAARAKLSLEAFLFEMEKAGVAPETFRDFVASGLLWRAAAREKFAGRIEVTEAEVDRALGMGASAGEGRRVLLSELVIPADGSRDVVALAGRVKLAIRTEKDFALMARQFSKATTAASGGELGWLDESALPGPVQAALSGLRPGEVTNVLPISGGAALYLLRQEGAVAGEGASVVEYALLAGGTGTLAAQVMGCDGLYPVARKGAVLTRETRPEAALPADLAAAVSGMDGGEARVLADGRVLVLCSRSKASGLPQAREAVRTDILNRKVGLLAEAWAEELRFNAFVETP
ncbi:peptidylprolyl isomerase [Stagnihabitans tardus]|uniref:Parvulin-like PPIase n=1 Tax=Stagnihabitans tardus TaxID=2699202 RepID=A0AAE4Y9S5_9RHOB|nr:peptidylprolyl isomerase [Stagnihabitans tardus]NBZ87476.1 hypothetical protein [Stagnihabitans tardus]